MQLPPFLTQNPDGEIVVTGHRIGLLHVVDYYNEGYSPEMLVGQFPTLTLSLVHKVIAFYLDNREAVSAYVANCRQALDDQCRAGQQLDLAALRERVESIREAST